MPLAEDQDMIQTFASQRSDQRHCHVNAGLVRTDRIAFFSWTSSHTAATAFRVVIQQAVWLYFRFALMEGMTAPRLLNLAACLCDLTGDGEAWVRGLGSQPEARRRE